MPTYGRKTGWMISGNQIKRVRILPDATVENQETFLHLYPYDGRDADARVVPQRVTAKGNYNIDTVTNFADFAELSNRFGMVFASDDIQVPEPTALVLMGLGGLLTMRRHRP